MTQQGEKAPLDAATLLAAHVSGGKQLVLAAAIVGDPDDFDVWSWRMKDWLASVRGALRYLYGQGDADTLLRTLDQPARSPHWQRALSAATEHASATVGLLEQLSSLRSEEQGESYVLRSC